MNPVNFIDLLSFGGKIPPVIVGTWLVMAILLTFAVMARRSLAKAADPGLTDDTVTLLSFSEVMTEGMATFGKDLLGEHDLNSYIGFFGTLFLFILTANLLGLVPGMEPPTSDTDLTWALAIICFIYYIYHGFKHRGFVGYLKSFIGPLWWLSWFMVMIEVIDNVARPFSLGIRLFANMFADHRVLGVFTGLTKLGLPVIFYALGSLVCVVQAFVFVLLAMIYVVMATHEH
ncbi:MAG TPA: F0F1 ATP synthase subunit A [Candidatus Binataceae bacterium]|nr:F0F1 ATP synthase subunit A [Candidatus Binataceae bacterium]